MPLVVVCGVPASGKSTLSRLLCAELNNTGKTISHIVSDDDCGLPRNEMYRNSAAEKQTRSLLKASIQRKLTSQTVVIADSLNYIKVSYDSLQSNRISRCGKMPITQNTTSIGLPLRTILCRERSRNSACTGILQHNRGRVCTAK
mmetsp:Transcript_42260/g.165016  ORF Transcript_42260/g.165016 Transcript_42260/m.165016 type:complete len:145 (-) Transcript_42260:2335-2769(-)